MTSKHSRITALITATILLVVAGCAIHKVTTVTANGTGGFTTNTVSVVDPVVLSLECGGVKLAAAGLTAAFIKNPSVVSALRDAQTALDGINSGANTITTAQVADQLKALNNPQLTREVLSFMQTLSDAEQKLLAKYGPIAAVQVTRALTQAVADGIGLGLAAVNP